MASRLSGGRRTASRNSPTVVMTEEWAKPVDGSVVSSISKARRETEQQFRNSMRQHRRAIDKLKVKAVKSEQARLRHSKFKTETQKLSGRGGLAPPTVSPGDFQEQLGVLEMLESRCRS